MAAAELPLADLILRSPLDGTVLDPLPVMLASDVANRVERARTAQRKWAEVSLEARIEAIHQVKDRILDRGEEAARILRLECGKPEAESWTAEILSNADLVDHWADNVESALAPEDVVLDAFSYPGKSGHIHSVPRGVIGLITPWNFPIAIPLRTIIPALLAGNAVIFKPSEFTPRAGAFIQRLFEGLLPENVFILAQGGGDVGQAIVDAGVDLVVFTGSVRTGKRIAVRAAERLIPVSLELGGKDAAIVLEDADIERTARGLVWGAFNNAGQNCAAIERCYVHRNIVKELTDRIVELTKALRPGEDVGPMTTSAQLEIVKEHIADAEARGAKVLCGGKETGVGLGFEPTVIELDASIEQALLMDEETFGPILPIVTVVDEDDAIRRANATRFGLTASIWCKNPDKGEKLVPRIRAGVVTVNNHGFTAAIAAAPWGGVGDSGSGVTNSKHALREFTRPKFTLIDRSRAKSELWWMPYSPSLVATVRALAVLRSGSKGLGAKIKAFWSLIINAPRRLMGR